MCDARSFPGIAEAFPNATIIDDFYAGCDRLEHMAQLVLDRIPGTLSVLGHSMGARVALEVCRLAPDRVCRLVLADTGFHTVRPNEAEQRHGLLALSKSQGIEVLCDRWLPPMLADDSMNNVALVSELRSMVHAAGTETYARQIDALLNRNAALDVLDAIRVPTMVMVGELDTWSPPEQHRTLAAHISGSVLEVVPGVGHMMPAEAAVQCQERLARWMSQSP